MGYDAYVYLIYGIRISYDANNMEEASRLIHLIVPDLIEEYGMDDVWGCFDEEPHTNGYYCLNFTDHGDETSEIFIACYFHQHSTRDDCKEVELQSAAETDQFRLWLVNNGINQEPKYYTKLYESY